MSLPPQGLRVTSKRHCIWGLRPTEEKSSNVAKAVEFSAAAELAAFTILLFSGDGVPAPTASWGRGQGRGSLWRTGPGTVHQILRVSVVSAAYHCWESQGFPSLKSGRQSGTEKFSSTSRTSGQMASAILVSTLTSLAPHSDLLQWGGCPRPSGHPFFILFCYFLYWLLFLGNPREREDG